MILCNFKSYEQTQFNSPKCLGAPNYTGFILHICQQMFTHGQGVLAPQMVHMHRLVGNQPHSGGSAFFTSENVELVNQSMGTNGHCSVGMAPHNFGSFGQPTNVMAFSSGQAMASGMDNPIVLMGQNFSADQMEVGPGRTAETNEETTGAFRMLFKCPECGLVKNSNGELEIHIKTEHLGWLPFQCPICSALRASDLQMREHIHSHHKKSETKYIYVDNLHAQKVLQEMVDKALVDAFQCVQQKRKGDELNGGASHQKKAQNNGGDFKNGPISAGGTANNKLASASGCTSDYAWAVPDDEEDDDSLLPGDSGHQMDRRAPQHNMADSFSASGDGSVHRGWNDDDRQRPNQPHELYRRTVRNRPGPMTSKKRVLGLCTECKKPITAGARQMHMFYHLGKKNSYRFRCKFPGCKVQHYRKDQMENHQSKVHGKINAEMMEDRSSELYSLVQEMSMKLLGTTGNTPGPTAGEAQRIYERQLRETEANLGTRKRRRPDCFGSSESNKSALRSSAGLPIYDSANRRVEELECRRCKKFILNRVKGFHILWHLNTDLGIVRYGCKHCNFKHDRPQSVAAHGAREHGDETACVDLLYNFESQLLAMSKDCFGVERLFEKEIRRRNRLERFARSAANSSSSFGGRIGSDENLQNPNKEGQHKLAQQQQLTMKISHPKMLTKNENAEDREWTPREEAKKRRSEGGYRFFGVRKPMAQKARDEMIKLREVSKRLGGAQYFRKRGNESTFCEKCGKLVVNRLSDHAYSHLEGCDLFRCQHCNLSHYSRDHIARHIKDFHNSQEAPMDNRLHFAQAIKDAIRQCYPQLFIDAPIPTKEDIDKLRKNLGLSQRVLVYEEEEEEKGEHEVDEGEEDEEELFKEDADDDGEGEEDDGREEEGEESVATNEDDEEEEWLMLTDEEEEENEDFGEESNGEEMSEGKGEEEERMAERFGGEEQRQEDEEEEEVLYL